MTRSNQLLVVGVAALLLASALGFGAARWLFPTPAAEQAEEHHEDEEDHGDEAKAGFVALNPAEAAAAGVTVSSVTQGGGTEIILSGRVSFSPNAQASVGAPLGGVVERVFVAPGTAVRAGTPLASVRSADGASARADAEAARTEVQAARANFTREGNLLKAGVVARQDWEASRTTLLKAEAAERAANARLAALGGSSTGGSTVIRSPIAGTVAAVQVAPGSFLAQGGAVAEIADPTRVELVLSAPASASLTIKPGDSITAQQASGDTVVAVVTAVAPTSATGAATVRARPVGVAPAAGTAVSARIVTDGAGAWVVPSDAVQTIDGQPVVFVMEAEGFRVRKVTPGRTAAGHTEILRGLSGSERIAGRGAFLLKAELAKGEAEHEH